MRKIVGVSEKNQKKIREIIEVVITLFAAVLQKTHRIDAALGYGNI